MARKATDLWEGGYHAVRGWRSGSHHRHIMSADSVQSPRIWVVINGSVGTSKLIIQDWEEGRIVTTAVLGSGSKIYVSSLIYMFSLSMVLSARGVTAHRPSTWRDPAWKLSRKYTDNIRGEDAYKMTDVYEGGYIITPK